MVENNYNALKLEKQLCFPLYACSREMIKLYKPCLEPLDLTYTQYVTMLVLWEEHTVNVKELGARLHLDSGTLTPLLKKLEGKGLVVLISLTAQGEALKEQAMNIPAQMAQCLNLTREESRELYRILYKMLAYSDELSV